MQLPAPVARADAVAHYAELLTSEALPSEALCLTAVRGLSVGRSPDSCRCRTAARPSTLADAGQASTNAYPDELPLVVAGELGGWVFLMEHNGFQGSLPEVFARLSRGTVAAAVYWNVNFNSTINLARDGQVLGEMDFASGAEPSADLAVYLDGLDFTDAETMCAEAVAFVERVTGVRIDADWASAPHQASAISPPASFEFSNPASWLEVNTPIVFAALPTAGSSVLREISTLAAGRACAAAGVDEADVLRDLSVDVDALSGDMLAQRRDELTALVHDAHQGGLNLRWDRCVPPDPQASRIAQLQADVVRRNTDTTAERLLS